MPDELTSYDRIPYRSYPYRQTHPDRLATIARLLGVVTAPIENCRVLELGCAGGGNLIPMAEQFPNSKFLGIDASSRQIDGGRKQIEELGMTNIRLQAEDILKFNVEPESFDYILSHGVYSWVPNPVQTRMLEIARTALKPNGVAYISYNTYPGWRMRGMIRDIMKYRARSFESPQVQLSQARSLLEFLYASVKGDDTAGWPISERVFPVKSRFSRSVRGPQSEAVCGFNSSTLSFETFRSLVIVAPPAAFSVVGFRELPTDDRLSLDTSLRDLIGLDPSPTPVINRHG